MINPNQVLDLLQTIMFVGVVACIRNAVVSLVQSGRFTHIIFSSIRAQSYSFQWKFIWKGILATIYKGKVIRIEKGISEYNNNDEEFSKIISQLPQFDQITHFELIHAGKACLWSTLAIGLAWICLSISLMKIPLYFIK